MHHSFITRRSALKTFAGSVSAVALPAIAAETPKRTGLGLVVYCTRMRREALRQKDPGFDLYDPLQFLKYCHSIGAGGMQCSLGVLDRQRSRDLREFVQQHDLYIDAIIRVPKKRSDLERFNAEMDTAAEVAAKAARTTIIPGRRYEFFDSLEKFNEFAAQARRSLELAAPVAERCKIPLAVENHKDQRDGERIELLRHISSPYVGACVDTGNSFALLEDPIQTVKDFAPWAHAVHLKDQALQLYEEGFLLGDIPLGQGGLDLREMVKILKQEKPGIRFSLELITRDPLKVPCLSEKFWATFPNVPGSDLARTLRYVRENSSNNLQYISRMSPAERLAREDANVQQSLDYARDTLGI